jgi:inosine/xanthosine triphosphatase
MISLDKIAICIGSNNPTKINATKQAFQYYFRNFELFNIKTDSGVSNQPIGLKEILKGALKRATLARLFLIKDLGKLNGIYGVGIEAGLVKIPHTSTGYMDFQFCAIIDDMGRSSLGSGIAFEYPEHVINQLKSNKHEEIGNIIGKLACNENLKNETGAISYLSKGILERTEILTQAVICALLPWANPEAYL